MAYTDPQRSNSRMIAIGIVALIHVGFGFALVRGLGMDGVMAVFEDTKSFNVTSGRARTHRGAAAPAEGSAAAAQGGQVRRCR